MFGIPGEVFWPTAAFATLIVLAFGGTVVLRLLPHRQAQALDQRDRDALDDVQHRLAQLDHLQQRVSELEERVDFTERLLAKQGEERRLAPPQE